MKVFHHSCFAMGTRFNVIVPDYSDSEGRELGSEIERILTEEENRLSCFLEESEVSMINRNAIADSVEVSKELAAVLDLCQYYHSATGGAFDPALLHETTQLKKYGFLADDGNLETTRGGWHDVDWHASTRKLFIKNPRTGIDLGAFGKGYALDHITGYLLNKGVESAFISFGESSVCAIGKHPLGDSWPLTITHPDTGVSVQLNLVNASISVSGLKKKKSDESEADTTPHIVIPGIGKYVTDNRLVVVKDESSLKAEILSTAIMAANTNQKQTILCNFEGVEIYEYVAGLPVFEKLT